MVARRPGSGTSVAEGIGRRWVRLILRSDKLRDFGTSPFYR